MAETRRPELRALTGARGIAAWLVVLYHIRESVAGMPIWALTIVAHGYLAVDFFFLLSGFVLYLTYADALRSGGWRAVPDFLWRRAARVWPLHAVVLSGTAALALVLAVGGRPDAGQFPFDTLPLHYLLVQNWGLTDRLAWNDPAWSISAEMAAYLAFPLLAFAIDWRRVPAWAIFAALMALFALLDAAIGGSLNADIPRNGMLRCVVEFSAGTAICGLWLRWRDQGNVALAALGFAAIFLLGITTGALSETLAVPAAFAAALLALAISDRRGNPLCAHLPHRLGELSYATYLAHFPMWKAFKLLLVSAPGAVGWPLIALYLLAVLAGSAVLYRWVERPAQRWLLAMPARIAGDRRTRRVA